MRSTILVGFDGSSQAHDALALATAIAGPQTEIVACCVHPADPMQLRGAPVPPDAPAEAEAEQRLRGARRGLAGHEHSRFVTRAAGSPAAGLHALAEELEADLLVVGSSHRGRIGRVIPGSVTRQALHAAPCAVAVASFGLHLQEEPRLHEIGVAFDGEAESRRALAEAAGLAADLHARLRIVSVADVSLGGAGWASAWVYPEVRDDLREICERQAREALEGVRAEVEASMEVIDGHPVQELILASSRFDLLVMGSRGYGPLRRALLGTVSTRVVEAAACSVLVVPRGVAAETGGEAVDAASAVTS